MRLCELPQQKARALQDAQASSAGAMDAPVALDVAVILRRRDSYQPTCWRLKYTMTHPGGTPRKVNMHRTGCSANMLRRPSKGRNSVALNWTESQRGHLHVIQRSSGSQFDRFQLISVTFAASDRYLALDPRLGKT